MAPLDELPARMDAELASTGTTVAGATLSQAVRAFAAVASAPVEHTWLRFEYGPERGALGVWLSLEAEIQSGGEYAGTRFFTYIASVPADSVPADIRGDSVDGSPDMVDAFVRGIESDPFYLVAQDIVPDRGRTIVGNI
jgi:hypothetical protein